MKTEEKCDLQHDMIKPIVNLIFSDHLQNGNLLQFRECKTTSRRFTANSLVTGIVF